ncbi:MAG: leucine-rich repeat domain-containing protein [Coriobacteriia bacterium]|nr:leucine-rich repeat domain-containing protein [Coriobacteriia bacterium]
MKFKLLAPAIAVAAALGVPGMAFAAEWTPDMFNWDADTPTKVLSLNEAGIENLQQTTDVVIPDVNANGDAVTAVGQFAFASSAAPAVPYTDEQKPVVKLITSLSFPDTIIELGNAVANSEECLTSVKLPAGITAIPSGAFLKNVTDSPALKNVVIPDGVTTIGSSAFAGCKVEAVILPDSLEKIDGSAFLNNQLQSVTLPSGVTTLGSSAFSVARPDLPKVLSTIILNEGLTTINSKAFSGCAATEVVIPTTVTTLNKAAFQSSVNTVTALVSTNAQLAGTTKFPVASLNGHVVKGDLDAAILAPIDDVQATGSAVEPEVTVIFDGAGVPADELTVTYANNVVPGIAKATVTAAADGRFVGTLDTTFNVVLAAADQEAVEQVREAIKTLPALDQITVDNPEAVAAAETVVAAFQAMTDVQKSAIDAVTASKLVATQGKIVTVKKAIADAAAQAAAEAQAKAEADKVAAEKAAADAAAAQAKAEAELKAAEDEKAKLAAALKEAQKPEQTIKVKVAKKSYKVKTLKAGARSFRIYASSNAGAKLSYKVVSCSSKLTFKAGKVTVKKGTKAGTYKVKVKITAAAKGKYKQTAKYRYITVKVVK